MKKKYQDGFYLFVSFKIQKYTFGKIKETIKISFFFIFRKRCVIVIFYWIESNTK
jgi:hypothetical protein